MPKPTDVPGLGARTPLRVAGPLLLRSRLADVRRLEALAAEDGEPDADAIHDMRVAARRLRAALDLIGDGDLRALEPQVEALQDALGEVRDVQVQRAWLDRLTRGEGDGAPGLGEPEREGASALAAVLDQEGARARKALRRALRAWRGAIAPALERRAGGAARRGKLGGKRVARVLRRALRRARRRVGPARAKATPAAVHRLRIRVKKLRYLAELAEPGRPDAVEALLSALVPVQEKLGELHDADVRVERLEQLAHEGPSRSRAGAESLLRVEREERARRAEALIAELARWEEARVLRTLAAGFGRRRRKRAAAHPEPTLEAPPVVTH